MGKSPVQLLAGNILFGINGVRGVVVSGGITLQQFQNAILFIQVLK